MFGSWDDTNTTIGVVGENIFNVKKEGLGTTATESDWRITVTVPGRGLPEMHVTDDAPKLTYEGQSYIDYFDKDSFEVSGLLPGESWRIAYSDDQRSCTIHFYKAEPQNDDNRGLLPTEDGQPRDIVICFKTNVNQIG